MMLDLSNMLIKIAITKFLSAEFGKKEHRRRKESSCRQNLVTKWRPTASKKKRKSKAQTPKELQGSL